MAAPPACPRHICPALPPLFAVAPTPRRTQFVPNRRDNLALATGVFGNALYWIDPDTNSAGIALQVRLLLGRRRPAVCVCVCVWCCFLEGQAQRRAQCWQRMLRSSLGAGRNRSADKGRHSRPACCEATMRALTSSNPPPPPAPQFPTDKEYHPHLLAAANLQVRR
jgi:hypothetical protein